MSLLPYLFDDDILPLARPRQRRRGRLLDQHFGLGFEPDDTLTILARPLSLVTRDYYRPWRQLKKANKDLGSTVNEDKDKLEYKLDVQQFTPEEITVKTADGFIVVEGKHEEKKDEHGFVSRRFVRRYALPEDCPPEKVQSKLSSDGILTVMAPRKRKATRERTIPVEITGPERKRVKMDGESTEQKDKMEE